MPIDSEHAVQDRIIGLLRERLGYEDLGDLLGRENACLDREALKRFLVGKQKLTPPQADRAIAELAKRMVCTGHLTPQCVSRKSSAPVTSTSLSV